MNADLSGSMWSVAPESATSKEVCLALPREQTIECGGGLFSKARTVLGRYTVLTPLGSILDLVASELDAGSKVTLRQEGVE